MPLETQLLEVPFARGMDQKSDARWIQVGTQTSIVNGSFNKSGALHKRAGFAAVSKTSFANGVNPTLAAGVAVESYKSAPVVSDGSHLYTYSSKKNILFYQDQLPECIATRAALTQTSAGVISIDTASTNGFVLYVYRAADSTGTVQNYATIIDVATGAQVAQSVLNPQSTVNGLRCISVGTDFWVFWTDSSKNVVGTRYRTAIPFSLWSPANPYVALSSSGTVWDVCSIEGGSGGFTIAYQDTGSPNHVHVTSFDINGAIVNTFDKAVAPGVSLPLVGVAVRHLATEMCWVMYVGTDGATNNFHRAFGLDPTVFTLAVADTALWTDTPLSSTRHCGIGRVNASTALFISSAATGDVSYQQMSSTPLLIGPLRTQAGYQMWSKPAEVGSSVICCLYKINDSGNRTFQVVDLNASDTTTANLKTRPIATVAPRSASFIGSMDNSVSPHIASMGSAQYSMPVSVSVSTTRDNVYHTVLDFASQQRHQVVELGDSAYIAGGAPSVFDGAQVTECGFLNAPVLGSASVVAGGSIDVGHVQYAVVYKWVNARGELVRSQPVFTPGTNSSGSWIGITTTPGNQTVQIPITPYNMTTKQDAANSWSPAVTFDLYRNTQADPATFWQVTADSSETISDPRTSGTVTITDNISDATLTSNAFGVLYTLGGVLTAECPPSLTCLTAHKNRLFGVGDDGTTIWYTQQFTTGFQPTFNDQLTMVCADGGVCTGLASLDDSLIVFKRDRIFRVAGSGPNNTGQQSDFSDFIRVSSDAGCTQSRSIVVAPQGVFFLSLQGLYLLTRAGEVVYVGKPVEDIVAANPVCLAADIVAAKGEIRWSLTSALPTDPTASNVTGVIVKYDYVQDAWSIDKYYDTDKALASAVVMGAKAPGGTWCWIGLGGQFYVESATSYLDNGQWVTLQVETADVKANGIGGWARFKRFFSAAEQKTPYSFMIEYAYDLASTYQPGVTWSDTQIAARTTSLVELDFQLGVQKTNGVRFRLTDAPPTVAAVGTGQGPVLLGNNIEVGIMPGSKGRRLQAAQRAAA